MDFLLNLLSPLMWLESWILWGWHKVGGFIGLGGGWAWALAIAGLTVVVRLVLMPLFVKQIHASRQMQLVQPELMKIQKKYKGKKDPESQRAMQQETMEFYKKTGTNPFSSCMPILLQMPFFFALFQVLNNLKAVAEGRPGFNGWGPIDRELAVAFENSMIFGSKLSDSFMFVHDSANPVATKVLTAVLIVLMSVTTFTTQHQLMRKNMPQSALDSPFAKQQKFIIYAMPFFFAFSGINFPIGVLIYWLTTNLWTMGQQFYVIRRMPAPGSAAEKALRERHARKGKAYKELTVPGLGTTEEPEDAPRQRQQPISKKRAKAQGVRQAGVQRTAGGDEAQQSDDDTTQVGESSSQPTASPKAPNTSSPRNRNQPRQRPKRRR